MAKRQYLVVDAFTSDRWAGNPASVVLDATGLSDLTMRAIAAEFNLSETAFILPASGTPCGNTFHLRWFTPTVEVSMCGHATVAAAHALVASGRWRDLGLADPTSGTASWQVQTLGGELTAFVERVPGTTDQSMFWLDLVDPVLSRAQDALDGLYSALGLEEADRHVNAAPVRSQDDDLLMLVPNVARLNACRPDFAKLDAWCQATGVRGVCVATTETLTPAIHVQSRFFAPAAGVNEDPVTGSVHGPLAAWLVSLGVGAVSDDGLTALSCLQGIPDRRCGMIHALVQMQKEAYAVRIGGQAVTTMHGTLTV